MIYLCNQLYNPRLRKDPLKVYCVQDNTLIEFTTTEKMTKIGNSGSFRRPDR